MLFVYLLNIHASWKAETMPLCMTYYEESECVLKFIVNYLSWARTKPGLSSFDY